MDVTWSEGEWKRTGGQEQGSVSHMESCTCVASPTLPSLPAANFKVGGRNALAAVAFPRSPVSRMLPVRFHVELTIGVLVVAIICGINTVKGARGHFQAVLYLPQHPG